MEETFRECVAEARRRGQAVSCPRTSSARWRPSATGWRSLRAGELVEVGTLAEMRHLSALSIDATFDATPPGPVEGPGATAVEVEGLGRC